MSESMLALVFSMFHRRSHFFRQPENVFDKDEVQRKLDLQKRVIQVNQHIDFYDLITIKLLI